jgi:D-3-phosphoglycerate dehydrogenase
MKVLAADKLEKSALDGLAALGCDIQFSPDLKGDALRDAAADFSPEVLVVRSTKVTRDVVEAASSLSLIIRAGAGVNTIDIEAASENGARVANCPGKNSIAVAELAFAHMLSCDRHYGDCVVDLRDGKWNKKKYSKAFGLYGRTLGLVGMGAIGQEMIPRAKAFGMNVIAFSRWMTPEVAAALGIARAESLMDVARQSDFISLHTALTPKTKGMIGKEFLGAMRDGAVLINTSRAEVVDEEALIAEAGSGRLRAGVDVMIGEPGAADTEYGGPLKDAGGIYATHHIGASTEQAQEAVAAEVVHIVGSYINTGHVPNVVNISKGGTASNVLTIRHQDRVGVLAAVFEILQGEGVSVQEMENIVLGGGVTAIAQISVDKKVSAAGIDKMNAHPLIFDTVQMGV